MDIDADGPLRQDLLTAVLGGVTVDRVRMQRIELAPGQAAGRHRHPCPVVGIVLSGSIRFALSGQPEMVLGAGTSFYEPMDTEVAHFDNASAYEPASFLACYLLAPGGDELIEMLGPATSTAPSRAGGAGMGRVPLR